jgi:HSP20 family protein
MVSLRDAMDRLFAESFVRPLRGWPERLESAVSIAVDLRETNDDVTVEAELPGLKPEDVDISITDNTLTMKGEFRSKEEGERGNVHFRERRYGSFQRAIALPTAIDAGATEAQFEDGVLTVTLPKVDEVKPRQIAVKMRS